MNTTQALGLLLSTIASTFCPRCNRDKNPDDQCPNCQNRDPAETRKFPLVTPFGNSVITAPNREAAHKALTRLQNNLSNAVLYEP